MMLPSPPFPIPAKNVAIVHAFQCVSSHLRRNTTITSAINSGTANRKKSSPHISAELGIELKSAI